MEHRVRRYLLGAGIGFVVSLVLLDRLIAALPVPEMPENAKAPRRMLEMYRHADPVPDVVFVGSSYASFGVDPETVDAVVADRGGAVRTFNMGAGGALALTNARLCRMLLGGPRPPRIIYFELSPGLLNSRFPSLREGVRRLGGWHEAAILWKGWPSSRLTAVLSLTFDGYHQWNDIRRIVTCARSGAPINHTRYVTTPRGWQQWLAGLSRRDDFVSQRLESREGYWGEFTIDRFSIDAVRELIDLAGRSGVTVRFFEMPMSSDWARITSPEIERRYADALEELRDAGMPDPWKAPAGLVDDHDFFDPDHLTAEGALKVSTALGEDLAGLLRATDRIARRQ